MTDRPTSTKPRAAQGVASPCTVHWPRSPGVAMGDAGESELTAKAREGAGADQPDEATRLALSLSEANASLLVAIVKAGMEGSHIDGCDVYAYESRHGANSRVLVRRRLAEFSQSRLHATPLGLRAVDFLMLIKHGEEARAVVGMLSDDERLEWRRAVDCVSRFRVIVLGKHGPIFDRRGLIIGGNDVIRRPGGVLSAQVTDLGLAVRAALGREGGAA